MKEVVNIKELLSCGNYLCFSLCLIAYPRILIYIYYLMWTIILPFLFNLVLYTFLGQNSLLEILDLFKSVPCFFAMLRSLTCIIWLSSILKFMSARAFSSFFYQSVVIESGGFSVITSNSSVFD